MAEWFPIQPAGDPISINTPITCRATQPPSDTLLAVGGNLKAYTLSFKEDVSNKGAKGDLKLEVGTRAVP